MSETAACQWWSLEGRGGAAGVGIKVAGRNRLVPAGSGWTVELHRTAEVTAEELPTVGRIAEERALGGAGTRD